MPKMKFDIDTVKKKIQNIFQTVGSDKKLMIASVVVGVVAIVALASLFFLPQQQQEVAPEQAVNQQNTQQLPAILTQKSIPVVENKQERQEKKTEEKVEKPKEEKTVETKKKTETTKKEVHKKEEVKKEEEKEPSNPVEIARKVVQNTDVDDSRRAKLINVEPLTGEEIYRLAQVKEELKYRKEIEKELLEIAKAKLERAMLAVNIEGNKKPEKKVLDSTSISSQGIAGLEASGVPLSGSPAVSPQPQKKEEKPAPEVKPASPTFPVIKVLGIFLGKKKAILKVNDEIVEVTEKQSFYAPGLVLHEVSRNAVIVRLNGAERIYYL